jgi:helicase MOV-10
MSVVLPSSEHASKERGVEPQLILCGDIHQLGPIITSSRARQGELDVSLLERLSARSLYATKSTAEGRRIASLGLLQPITWLLSNYRSHPGILLLPSTLFYDDTLEPKANVPVPAWKWLPNSKLPVAIRGIESTEDWVEEASRVVTTRPHRHLWRCHDRERPTSTRGKSQRSSRSSTPSMRRFQAAPIRT